MRRRNETQPIVIAPKIKAPASSWWIEARDQASWYQRAAEEAARMQGSRVGHQLRTRLLDEVA